MPASTIELAAQISGMYPELGAPAGKYDDVSFRGGDDDHFGPSYGARDPYSELAAEIGYGQLASPQPGGYGQVDVSGWRQAMGL